MRIPSAPPWMSDQYLWGIIPRWAFLAIHFTVLILAGEEHLHQTFCFHLWRKTDLSFLFGSSLRFLLFSRHNSTFNHQLSTRHTWKEECYIKNETVNHTRLTREAVRDRNKIRMESRFERTNEGRDEVDDEIRRRDPRRREENARSSRNEKRKNARRILTRADSQSVEEECDDRKMRTMQQQKREQRWRGRGRGRWRRWRRETANYCEKARPSKANSRFRECASHDCLKIHSFIHCLGSSFAACPLLSLHVEPKEVDFARIHTCSIYTDVHRHKPAPESILCSDSCRSSVCL